MIIEKNGTLYNSDLFHTIKVFDSRLWMDKEGGAISIDFGTNQEAMAVYDQIKNSCSLGSNFICIDKE